MDDEQKKFSLVEIIVGGIICLVVDVIAIIADLLGVDLGWLIQIPTWLIFTFWFTIKGVRATASLEKRFLVPIGAQLLPDWLIPAQLTLSFLITAYIENHPEKFGVITATAAATTGGAVASGAAGGKITATGAGDMTAGGSARGTAADRKIKPPRGKETIQKSPREITEEREITEKEPGKESSSKKILKKISKGPKEQEETEEENKEDWQEFLAEEAGQSITGEEKEKKPKKNVEINDEDNKIDLREAA